MSDDDVNQLTPDDGDLDEVSSRAFARLFSMTWSSTTPSEITPLHQCLKPSTTNLRRRLSTLSRNADSDHRGFSSLQRRPHCRHRRRALVQLRSGQSDTAELSVQESSRERSEENLQSESEEFAFAKSQR